MPTVPEGCSRRDTQERAPQPIRSLRAVHQRWQPDLVRLRVDPDLEPILTGRLDRYGVQLSHHVPEAQAGDYMPLVVMDAALTGPMRMSFSGGGGTNRSSRLYQALIETELATAVGGSLVATRDPYTYDLAATVHTGRSLQEVEDAVCAQLEQLAAGSITEQELNKAVKQSKAQFAYAAEHVTNQAYWLGWTETVAGYLWFEEYIDRLLDVTADDVQRVAQTYLKPSNRTTGWYVPTDGEART